MGNTIALLLLLLLMTNSCNHPHAPSTQPQPPQPPQMQPPPATTSSALPVVPLLNVHAHNDYEHRRPLYDALDCGFCSIEADIYLIDGKLLVAHERYEVTPSRTLESLYLDPLRQRIRENAGRVYRDGPSVALMIDFKSPPDVMYPVLRKLLMNYRDMLTTWHGDTKDERAITVILTGDRPTPARIADEETRYVALDGHLGDLTSDVPPSLMPRLGIKWQSVLHWNGHGPMPDTERAALRKLVEQAHAKGRQLRLWGGPDNLAAWKELRSADVDLINTDHLPEVRDFLLHP